ncbi:MAG: helix-turn-helix domain-containing protein [Eubacteriales bacterium]|nr:helix-turn-helix domain-containing protein [Eubacteriales bacterium]
MELSSAYLCEQLTKDHRLLKEYGLSGKDRYRRPLLYMDRLPGQVPGSHVCILCPREEAALWKMAEQLPGDSLPILCVLQEPEEIPQLPSPSMVLFLPHREDAVLLSNRLQQIFDEADQWELQIHQLVTQNMGISRILQEASSFLDNPLMVMGLDFSLVGESGLSRLPAPAQLFTPQGVNMEYMNALLQDPAYQALLDREDTVLFPGYISGCPSLNRNLYVEGKPLYRLVLTQWDRPVTEGDICILESLTDRLEYLLTHEVAASITGDLEQIFLRILSDRTADYVQVSRQLSALGWRESHTYLCLILQITYLNQKQLSTKAICRYIRSQFEDSISFLYQEEIVTFLNLTRLGLAEDEAASRLIYFIRDSYLKAGYSRPMAGHMNLRRQYVQARTALDVGSRTKPYLWIHHFSQVALTYIMEQATRRLPGSMICHEGLLRLKETDESSHTEYVRTLKTYLDQHLNATQTAKELFIHRSTFLYRLDKIREILSSDLEDPQEIFYLELSLRLLEQEEEKS